jgi:hypothetical protein
MELSDPDPIFIHGILPRSGTNFLWDLMLLHPDVAAARDPIREDLFLDHSDSVFSFVSEVRASWNPLWGDFPPDVADQLLRSIGDGLVSFLWEDRSKRLLSKSPSVRNLRRFFALFPNGRLVVLLRDGRSVVQSSMSTFGWDFTTAARRWAEAADEISRFREAVPEAELRSLIVRYEDLVDAVRPTIEGILEFCGLDPKTYDFDSAERLPVRGSSVFFGSGRDTVHWEPVTRDETFDPKRRWDNWTPDMHDRFWWIAGNRMSDMGYHEEEPRRGDRRLVQRMLDARWAIGRALRWSVFRARVRIGMTTRPFREKLGLVRSR